MALRIALADFIYTTNGKAPTGADTERQINRLVLCSLYFITTYGGRQLVITNLRRLRLPRRGTGGGEAASG